MNRVHVVVPAGVDDPTRPSGGNVYDRRICDNLTGLGWQVVEHAVPGGWPTPDTDARGYLARVISGVDNDSLVLIDGLIASSAGEVLLPQSARVRQVVLMHMPQGDEGRVVSGAAAVVATSSWTRQWLLDAYALPPEQVHVVEPGAERAELATSRPDGTRLLSVAAVVPHKGHDRLIAALAAISHLDWTCTCVGSLDRDAEFAAAMRQHVRDAGLSDRVRFSGPLVGPALSEAYATADVLVHPTRAETYGMVITEALARGLPVIATDVGGVSTALGTTQRGRRPGLLVESDDMSALATALEQWLTDAPLRAGLRAAAAQRRATLSGWDTAAEQLSRVLVEVAS